MLATDGLWDVVPPGRALRLLRAHATPKAAAMEAVSAVATQRSGLLTDDITGGGRQQQECTALWWLRLVAHQTMVTCKFSTACPLTLFPLPSSLPQLRWPTCCHQARAISRWCWPSSRAACAPC